jgi:hypothetical protein
MRIAFCVILLSLVSFAKAQISFPKTPTKFLTEFKAHVLKTASDTQKVQFANFETVWASERITPFHKKTTMKAIQSLSDRKVGASSMLQAANVLSLAVDNNASSTQLDTLVQIFEYSFEKNQPKEIQFLLTTLENYIGKKILYKDAVHTIYVENGNLDFSLLAVASNDDYSGGYDDWGTDAGFDNMDKQNTENQEEPNWDEVNWDEVDANNSASETPKTYEISAEPMPYLDGPLLKLNNVNIKIVTALDTVVIQNTSGKLSLTNGEFVGNGAKFDWSLVGKPEVYATFKDYHFSIKKPELKVEDVTLTYPEKVDGEVKGIFDYNYQRRKIGTKSSYPRFMSYQNNVTIKGLGENIEYYGGLGLNGDKIFSSCVENEPSVLKVKKDGELKFKAIAPYFELNDTVFQANPTRVVIYFADNDSITHPGVQLKYVSSTEDFFARKDKTKYKDAPFTNSYHRLERLHYDHANHGWKTRCACLFHLRLPF